MYRDYWGDQRPGYNFTDAGISVMTTSSCTFAAAAGMQPASVARASATAV